MSPRGETPRSSDPTAGLRLLATLPPRPSHHDPRPQPGTVGWFCTTCGRPLVRAGHWWNRGWEHEPDPEAAGFRRR